ncbi:MFS transporter [Melissospora conviva]|uniref:MFS transporter n=1 Tax=Melissospora conviva TaxID=3388432 RepID=UPI003B77DD75
MTYSGAKERIWTRDLVFAWIVNFFLAFVFYMLMTTMALYAVERFSASDTLGGLASSIFVIGATISRLFAGNLVELFGRRRMLGIALVVFVLTSLSYLVIDGIDSVALLLVVRAIHGAAFAIGSTAVMTLAQSIIPRSRRAEGTGYFTLSMTLATAIGPSLALMLVHGPGYIWLFTATATAAVLAMAAALFLRAPDKTPSPEHRARLRRFHPSDMLHRDVVPVASFMLVLAVCYAGVLTFLNSYADERGLATGASLFFLAYAITLFAARLIMGPLQDRRGDNLVVYISIAAFAVSLVMLGLATTNVVLVLAGAFMGLGFGTLMSALQSIAVSRVPMPRMGLAISTHFFMLDLGIGLGPVLLGVLLNQLGYNQMYLVLAGVVVVSTGLYHLVHGRVERAEHEAPVPVDATV